MAQCISPFTKKDDKLGMVSFPCGKCPECHKRRISGWSFRLTKQGQISESALFVTLTYNTDHIPITQKGYRTLNKKDCQKFFKRLRQLYPKSWPKISYYICGEYGGKTWRPHYHAIIFNALHNEIEKAWSINGREIGTIHIGNVSDASIGYTLKYMSKPKKIPVHANDDRQQEFSLMSKKMGANYLTNNMRNWHFADMLNRQFVPLHNGKKIAMPRYYKDKLYTDYQRQRIAVHLMKLSDIKWQEGKMPSFEMQRDIIIHKLNRHNKDQRLNLTL